MTRLAAKFSELRERSEKALVLFVTAGDPDLQQLPAIIDALAQGGADIVEVGIPFSDPIADGPTIQASSQRALDRGVTPAAVFSILEKYKAPVPLVAMGYYNSIHRMGMGNAADALKRAGFSGSIISDLTPEESIDWCEASWAAGLDNVFLAAPTSTDERLKEVARRASGFLYAVSRTGVTGSATEVPPEAKDLVRRLRNESDLPICVGFGVSTPDHVKTICEFCDGAVVGSKLVDLLATQWENGAGKDALIKMVRELKVATKQS